jgi:HD-like signal output (HDOD) protein
LSGHAERESVVKALPVAHQFLHKPCDGDLLRIVVERACELQRMLQDEKVRCVIGKLDKLPSVPQAYWELTQAAARPGVTMAELARIVERDPAMSVKVLQLVNSSYFGIAQRLTSVQAAVSYLGIDLLKALALMVHAFAASLGELALGFSLEELQRHSLLTARLAKRIVQEPKLAGEAFTACVIKDIGKIVLALGMPDRYAEVVRNVRDTGRPFHVVEREQLGLSHAEVGAFLLGFWGLPLSIVEAVAYHHTPSLVQGGDVTLLATVHVADALVEGASQHAGGHTAELDLAFVQRLDWSDKLPLWTKFAEEIVAAS